jgi:DNA-directed RNA polymerase subunit RPC12/RpoP
MTRSLDSRIDRLEGVEGEWTLYRGCARCGRTVLNGTQNEGDAPCQHEAREILSGRADIVIPPRMSHKAIV